MILASHPWPLGLSAAPEQRPGKTLTANYQSRQARVYTGNAPKALLNEAITTRYHGREMAVLTAIAEAEAKALLEDYRLGAFGGIQGIPAGSVNSNYAVALEEGRIFLRIYEEQDRAGAESETAMLVRLAAAGVPTPAPHRRKDGGLVSVVRGKPAALFPWRDGAMRCQAGVTVDDARQVGESTCPKVHIAGAGEKRDEGRFRLEDLTRRLDRIEASGNESFVTIAPALRAALLDAHTARDAGLSRGMMHGDLFRDNVLWGASGDIAALLDFESASDGTYAYDLMVTVLAWCVGDDIDGALARAMVDGYDTVRPVDERERRGFLGGGLLRCPARHDHANHRLRAPRRRRRASGRQGLAALHDALR